MTAAEKTAKIKAIDAKIAAIKVSLQAAQTEKTTLMSTQVTTESIKLYDLIPEASDIMIFSNNHESEINKKIVVELLKDLVKESDDSSEFIELYSYDLPNNIKNKYKQDVGTWLSKSDIEMFMDDAIKYLNNVEFKFGKKVGLKYTLTQFFDRFK